MKKRTELILRELKRSYGMELEMVQNYLAISIDASGLEDVSSSLSAKVSDKLGHARRLGHRIKVLGGQVFGVAERTQSDRCFRFPFDSRNDETVIFAVLGAEESAIAHYKRLIDLCDGIDSVTQDLIIQLLSEEQEHYRQFSRFAELIRARSAVDIVHR